MTKLSPSGLDEDSKTDREEVRTDTESDSEDEDVTVNEDAGPPNETFYMENVTEELGQVGGMIMLNVD